MATPPVPGSGPAPPAGDAGPDAADPPGVPVDVRGSTGVQVGEGNTQIIYSYNGLTFGDVVAPPPLATFSGRVESPYRGLAAFGEQDAPFFFGREAAAATCWTGWRSGAGSAACSSCRAPRERASRRC